MGGPIGEHCSFFAGKFSWQERYSVPYGAMLIMYSTPMATRTTNVEMMKPGRRPRLVSRDMARMNQGKNENHRQNRWFIAGEKGAQNEPPEEPPKPSLSTEEPPELLLSS